MHASFNCLDLSTRSDSHGRQNFDYEETTGRGRAYLLYKCSIVLGYKMKRNGDEENGAQKARIKYLLLAFHHPLNLSTVFVTLMFLQLFWSVGTIGITSNINMNEI